MQLVAQWGVLRDGDDRRFAGVAFLALDALFAFSSTLASGTNGALRAGIALWADGAGRPLDRDIAIRIERPAAVPAAGPRVVIHRRLPLT